MSIILAIVLSASIYNKSAYIPGTSGTKYWCTHPELHFLHVTTTITIVNYYTTLHDCCREIGMLPYYYRCCVDGKRERKLITQSGCLNRAVWKYSWCPDTFLSVTLVTIVIRIQHSCRRPSPSIVIHLAGMLDGTKTISLNFHLFGRMLDGTKATLPLSYYQVLSTILYSYLLYNQYCSDAPMFATMFPHSQDSDTPLPASSALQTFERITQTIFNRRVNSDMGLSILFVHLLFHSIAMAFTRPSNFLHISDFDGNDINSSQYLSSPLSSSSRDCCGDMRGESDHRNRNIRSLSPCPPPPADAPSQTESFPMDETSPPSNCSPLEYPQVEANLFIPSVECPSTVMSSIPDVLHQVTIPPQIDRIRGGTIPTPLPDSIRPARLLPLPAALGSVIDEAIAGHLQAATARLVEPTIQGIVDACIPRLAEFMETHLVMLTPPQCLGKVPCKGKKKTDPKSCEEDYDGDDDEGAVTTFYDYLWQKKVIPSRPKGNLPPSAPIDVVHTFNQDGVSPPLLENIALDWHCSSLMSSHWNSEAISILSLDFYNNLKGSASRDVIFDEKTMSLQVIRKMCKQKLAQTYQAHRQVDKINMATGNKQTQVIAHIRTKKKKCQKGDRMIARSHGNHSQDPETWDAIRKIIDKLGVEGMSGDETDCPPASKPRVLWCLELPWINPAIFRLFLSVETYESAHRIENMLEQVGNLLLKRCWEAGRKEVKSTPIPELPRNWYDDDWFKGLAAGAHSVLSVRKYIAIPSLEQSLYT
ncbi:hypothetical protein HD554DRAFT_2035461 [Boletus coccyginus]|nr:hypothetical protein HD554DRAFT_2035461 [Boletus coccyginus]